MRVVLIMVSFMILLSSAVLATSFDVDADRAELQFSGEHAGRSFSGVFTQWQGNLQLPPAENPQINASFVLSSAKTGNAMYDDTLPESDWFAVEDYPHGQFVSETIELVEQGYAISGSLSLRGKTQPVSFLLERSADKMTAEFAIDRLAFDIGLESDPDAEWVSREIMLRLTILTQ